MKMSERIAVFDVLGPAYHYDPNGWNNGAVEPLIGILKREGYKGKNLAEEARDEEAYQRTGNAQIYIMPGFAETVLYLREQGVRPVVVSAGTGWVLENILGLAAQDYEARTGIHVDPEELVEYGDLHSTIPIGDKKVPATWAEAVRQYGDPETVAVYEDTWKNLEAAVEGLDADVGYHVVSTRSGLAVVKQGRIYRGHMEEALGHLRDNLDDNDRPDNAAERAKQAEA